MRGHGEKLSRKEEAFLAALLTEPTVQAAAKAVGISEATAWRWMQRPDFKARYQQARRELVEAAIGKLQKAATQAVDTLAEIAAAGEKESARVQAAKGLLELCLKACEVEDLARRIEELERRLEAMANGRTVAGPH